MAAKGIWLMLAVAWAIPLLGCQKASEGPVTEACICESHAVPPQSPLWGYQQSPGINKYEMSRGEIFLGDYFQYGPAPGEMRREEVATKRPAAPPPAAYVPPSDKSHCPDAADE